MPDDIASRSNGSLSRRSFWSLVGTTGVAALAGCAGVTDGPDENDSARNSGPAVHLLDSPEPRSEVALEVRNSSTPVEGAHVTLDDRHLGTTDADGRLSLTVPFQDEFTLTITWGGEVRVERTIELEHPGNRYRYQFEWFDTTQPAPPTGDARFNPHVPGETDAVHGLFAPYAQFDLVDHEFLPYLFEDWTHRDGRLLVSMRDDVTWETGDAVDAAAIAFQWEILLEAGHVAASVIEDVTATGDYEVRFDYEPGTNRRVVEHAVLHERADHAPADWEPVRDGAVDAAELVVDEPTASGPLTLTQRTDSYREYTVRNHVDGVADHPAGDHYNWNGYRVHDHDERGTSSWSLPDGFLDGVRGRFTDGSDLARSDAEDVVSIDVPGTYGLGLWFDHGDGPFTDRLLRRAIARSLDVERAHLSALAETKIVQSPQTGLSDTVVRESLGGPPRDGFRRYERDVDEATALAERAGYTIGDVGPRLLVPSLRGDRYVLARQIGRQLRDAGWDVDLYSADEPARLVDDEVEFDLAVLPHSTGVRQLRPYYSFRYALYGDPETPASVANYATSNRGAEVVVDGEAIDVQDQIDALATSRDEDRRRTIVRRLARVVNCDLPYVHLSQNVVRHYVDADEWQLPDDSRHLRTTRPLWWLPFPDEELAVPGQYSHLPGLLEADRPVRPH